MFYLQEFDIDPEADGEQVDELLAACVKQAVSSQPWLCVVLNCGEITAYSFYGRGCSYGVGRGRNSHNNCVGVQGLSTS